MFEPTPPAIGEPAAPTADSCFDDIPDEWDPATPGEAFAGAALMLGSAVIVLGLAWSLVWAIGAAFFKGQN